MKYKITFTERFQKSFKKLNDNEKKILKSKIEILSQNSMQPLLRTKSVRCA